MTDVGELAPILEVESLAVDFATRRGTIHAVRDATWSLRAGECLAIVGESGSGKSVTARSLVGLAGSNARVRANKLRFEETDLCHLAEGQWRRLRGGRIGFVLQDALTSLDPLRRVGDEVAEPLDVHRRLSRPERYGRVLALLEDVGIPEPELRARQHPHELSGGLRQRALIASAIATGPSLVIADEPTTALDVTVQAQVLDLLAVKKEARTAVLLISHDLTVVARMADRVAVMYAGLIVEQGPAAQILAQPLHPYTADLLAAAPGVGRRGLPLAGGPGGALAAPAQGPGCPYASRCSLADDHCRSELPVLGAHGPSAQVRCWHPGKLRGPAAPDATESRVAISAGAAIVEVNGISKRFRSPDGSWRLAVNDVSFTLNQGEALGVVGESGSGKTTTAQIVLGMLAPDTGSVRLDGTAWSELKERDRRLRRSRIQIIYQDPLSSFDPRFTVERIVGEAFGRPGRRGASANRSHIVELLARVGLDETHLTRRGPTLSGGQRQRVAIARALAPAPDVIVCDEPVSALDVSVQAQILDLFAKLQTGLGVALLFISHDLGVIHQVCDRVLIMKDGSVVEEGDVARVFANPQHPYTRSLLAALPDTERPSAVTTFHGAL